MNAVVESSVIVGWLRRVASGSVVCRFLWTVTRPLRRAARLWTEVVERRLTLRGKAPRQAAGIPAVIEGSRLVSSLERFLYAPLDAWRHSAASKWLQPIVRQATALEPWRQIRLMGWTLLVALVTYRLVASAGRAATTVVDLVIWGAGLAVAMGLMAGSRAVASAWRDRRPVRSRMH